jgi:hypothetical protein
MGGGNPRAPCLPTVHLLREYRSMLRHSPRIAISYPDRSLQTTNGVPNEDRALLLALLDFAAVRCRTDRYLVCVQCSPYDTVGDLKKFIAAQSSTDWKKIQFKKWYDMDSALVSTTVLKSACPGKTSTRIT